MLNPTDVILDLVTEDAYALWEISESVVKVIGEQEATSSVVRATLLDLHMRGLVRIGFREHVIDCPKFLEPESVEPALNDAEYWTPADASIVVVATEAGDEAYNMSLRESVNSNRSNIETTDQGAPEGR